MNDLQLGRTVRAVRLRLRWRQCDVAAKAGVSITTVGRVEHGELAGLRVSTVRRVLAALEIDLALVPRWRGGDIDRLADESHATLVGVVADRLRALGWLVQAEVSYSVYGERGSIDLLAWHAPSRTLLVVEVKTSLNSIEETLRRQDVKVRLGAGIARERFGWQVRTTGALLVLPDDVTARRRVARHEAVLGPAYPLRHAAARRWLAAPSSEGRLLVHFSLPRGGRAAPTVRARRRVGRLAARPRTPVGQSLAQ